MEAESSIVVGPGSQTGGTSGPFSRWGDYTSMAIDPSDDCTFWYTNQYEPNTGSYNWATQIASFKFSSCGSNIFVPTGSMTIARDHHTATLLNSGQVLIAGGDENGTYLSSAELYNASTGTFAATGSMTVARHFHTATLLSNGQVLIAGGDNGTVLSSAELYK